MLTDAELQAARDVAEWDDTGAGPKSYQILGSGYFSTVYAHPTRDDLAVKVSSSSNDGGVLYAFWARARQDLPGVPRILHIEQIKRGEHSESIQTIIVMARYRETLSQYGMYNTLPQFQGVNVEDIKQALAMALRGECAASEEAALALEPTGLLRTLKAIGEFFRGSATFDLHSENIMLDDDLNLIITDPLSFVKETPLGC